MSHSSPLDALPYGFVAFTTVPNRDLDVGVFNGLWTHVHHELIGHVNVFNFHFNHRFITDVFFGFFSRSLRRFSGGDFRKLALPQRRAVKRIGHHRSGKVVLFLLVLIIGSNGNRFLNGGSRCGSTSTGSGGLLPATEVDPQESEDGHGTNESPFGFVGQLTDGGEVEHQHRDEQHPDSGPCESHVPHPIQSLVLYDGDGGFWLSSVEEVLGLRDEVVQGPSPVAEPVLRIGVHDAKRLAVRAHGPEGPRVEGLTVFIQIQRHENRVVAKTTLALRFQRD